ncbi:MAG: hypothetical protein M3Y53_11340, partial [Thermoproteota archaeon]|nr:hypothetical protein [Thermoproteota archaeon]
MNRDDLWNSRFLELLPCSQFSLVFQVTWFGSQSISTARTPQTIPLYENFTYLTSLLSASVTT